MRKKESSIGKWIRDVLIISMGIWIIGDQVSHSFDAGYRLGYQLGHQQGLAQGLNQQPQMWKSTSKADKIH